MNVSFESLKKIRWFEWLHHFYIVVAITGLLASVFTTSKTAKEEILLFAFAVYFLVLLVFVVFFALTNGAKARYAEALSCMHEAVHIGRNIYHKFDWAIHKSKLYENAEFRNDLVRVLTSAAQAFSITTGVKCRVCIKVIGFKNNSPDSSFKSYFVTTLARDSVSQEQSREKDANESEKHLISDNTDFNLILKRERNYFFHNNLQKLEHYENSSFKLSPEIKKYSSTLVFPIRYVYTEEEKSYECAGGLDSDQDIYGFLAIDSYSRNVFSERYDVQLGSLLADDLYSVFDKYREYKLRTETQNNGGNNGQAPKAKTPTKSRK